MSSVGGAINSTIGRVGAAVLAVAALGAGVLVAPTVTGSDGSSCTTTVTGGGSINTAVANVTAGGTLCLGAASNWAYTGSTSKASQTTITAADGVAASTVIFTSFSTGTSNRLTFDSIRVAADGSIGSAPGSTGSTNLTLSNSSVTGAGSLCIQQSNNNANVLVDNVDFGDTDQACGEGRLDIKSTCSNCGITVRNSTFGPSGAADGIQVHWGLSGGVTIGPGNTFTGIVEDDCGVVHCDSIQIFGATNVTVTGNYFVNDSTVIANFDCATDEGAAGLTFTNNVAYQETGSAAAAVSIAGGTGDVITHNTLGPGTDISIDTWNDGCSNTGLTVRNNVFHGGCDSNATSSTITHNLVNGGGACVGTSGVSGNPTYTGGTTPSSWAGFALTGLSSGHLAASDGLDMGATSFGS